MFKRKESRKNEEQRFTVSNGRLTVDCKGCKGQSSLCDRNCLLCVCERIVEEGNVSSISLRSSIDRAIDGDAVTSIRELAFLHRLLSMNRSERKGKKCARCKRSFSALVKDQLTAFPDVDVMMLRGRMAQMQFPDTVCSLCASDTLNLINAIEDTLKNVGMSNSPFEKGVE